MHHDEQKPFSLKHTLGSTLAWWYTLFLGWTTRIYWFKTEEARTLEEQGKGIAAADADHGVVDRVKRAHSAKQICDK